jgi:ribose transport system permease protein
VRVERVWTLAFALSGASSALVGLLLAGYSGGGDSSIGDPYLFMSIAAVVIGGTTLTGAVGDYWRTCIGAVMLTELNTILIGDGASAAVQEIVYGVLILVVTAGYSRQTRLRDRF